MKLRNATLVLVSLSLAAVPLLAVPLLAAGSDRNKQKDGNNQDAVAVVNGEPISRTTYERHLGNERSQRMQNGQILDDAAEQEMKSAVLENLIDSELLYQAGVDRGLEAEDQQVAREYESIRENFQNAEAFSAALDKSRYTEQSLKQEIGRNLVIQQYIQQEIAPSVAIGTGESRDYYDQNPEVFTQQEQVRASHIIIRVEDRNDQAAKAEALRRIEDIQNRVRAGEDFGELARELSEGPSNEQGGDLGFFQRGQMVASFEETAFSLEPGEVSGIVETSYGYHLIKVTDRRPESLAPFEQVEGQIAEYLQQSELMEEIDRTLQTLRGGADIRRFVALSETG